jgi:hypothetical protein
MWTRGVVLRSALAAQNTIDASMMSSESNACTFVAGSASAIARISSSLVTAEEPAP